MSGLKYLAYFQATGEHYHARTHVPATIEDRLRASGVFAAIRRASLDDTRRHYESENAEGNDADTNRQHQGENAIRSDV